MKKGKNKGGIIAKSKKISKFVEKFVGSIDAESHRIHNINYGYGQN